MTETKKPKKGIGLRLFGAAAWLLSWRYSLGNPENLDYGQMLGDLGAAKSPSISGMGQLETAWQCLKIQAKAKASRRRGGPPDKNIPEGSLVSLNKKLFK